jgi:hypothetical protein
MLLPDRSGLRRTHYFQVVEPSPGFRRKNSNIFGRASARSFNLCYLRPLLSVQTVEARVVRAMPLQFEPVGPLGVPIERRMVVCPSVSVRIPERCSGVNANRIPG